jgi:hypothetical protein
MFAVRCMYRIAVSSSISIMRTFFKPKQLPAWTRAILDTRVGLLPCSQQSAAGPCSQPDQFSPHLPPFISVTSVLIVSHNICLDQLCGLLSSGLPPESVHLSSHPCFYLSIPFPFDFVPLILVVACLVNSTNYDTR